MDQTKLEERLQELPLYEYAFLSTDDVVFTDRVRHICKQECPMYNKTWACPPAVGTLEECGQRCRRYENCLIISTAAEVSDIGNMAEGLATRAGHEETTAQVRQILRDLGAEPYVLSTQACAICEHCAWLEGKPCRYPEKMNPCVESHSINLIPTLEKHGLEFAFGRQVITWFSLLFF
jgi:predicted metal-binding protein